MEIKNKILILGAVAVLAALTLSGCGKGLSPSVRDFAPKDAANLLYLDMANGQGRDFRDFLKEAYGADLPEFLTGDFEALFLVEDVLPGELLSRTVEAPGVILVLNTHEPEAFERWWIDHSENLADFEQNKFENFFLISNREDLIKKAEANFAGEKKFAGWPKEENLAFLKGQNQFGSWQGSLTFRDQRLNFVQTEQISGVWKNIFPREFDLSAESKLPNVEPFFYQKSAARLLSMLSSLVVGELSIKETLARTLGLGESEVEAVLDAPTEFLGYVDGKKIGVSASFDFSDEREDQARKFDQALSRYVAKVVDLSQGVVSQEVFQSQGEALHRLISGSLAQFELVYGILDGRWEFYFGRDFKEFIIGEGELIENKRFDEIADLADVEENRDFVYQFVDFQTLSKLLKLLPEEVNKTQEFERIGKFLKPLDYFYLNTRLSGEMLISEGYLQFN